MTNFADIEPTNYCHSHSVPGWNWYMGQAMIGTKGSSGLSEYQEERVDILQWHCYSRSNYLGLPRVTLSGKSKLGFLGKSGGLRIPSMNQILERGQAGGGLKLFLRLGFQETEIKESILVLQNSNLRKHIFLQIFLSLDCNSTHYIPEKKFSYKDCPVRYFCSLYCTTLKITELQIF